MESPGKQIWSVVTEAFGRLRGKQARGLWLDKAEPSSFHRGLFTLDVQDASMKEAIDSCYREDIESIFLDITGSPVRLRTRVATGQPERFPADDVLPEEAGAELGAEAAAGASVAGGNVADGAGRRVGKARPTSARGRPADRRRIIPISGPTRFAQTPANEFAFRAVERFVEGSSAGFNPLFIHGPVGCGKSALAHHALRGLDALDEDVDPLVLSGESLARDVRRASRNRTFGALQRRWAEYDTIVLDEAHRLRGQRVAQTVAVSLLGPALSRGGRVLVLSRHAPQDIHGLGERLLSHFEAGLVVAMREPDASDRLAALEAATAGLPVAIDADALAAVCERCPGTLTDAVALLQRACEKAREDGHASVRLTEVEPRLVRAGRGPQSMDLLVDLLCQETGVCPDRLRSSEKTRDVAGLRHLCVYLASRSLGLSSRQICRSLRLRSPSIVAYARRAVERRRASDAAYEKLIHVLQARLAGAQRDFEW